MALPKPQGPLLEIAPDLETVYTNLARISHSPADIVLDFAQLLPAETKAIVKARVWMSPLSAKLLLRALTENIARYEAAFGEINVPVNSSLAENLFKPHQSRNHLNKKNISASQHRLLCTNLKASPKKSASVSTRALRRVTRPFRKPAS